MHQNRLSEEPAYEVFRLYTENYALKKIIAVCVKKYGHLEENIPQFVDEIIQHINYYNNPLNEIRISKKDEITADIQSKILLSPTYYKIDQLAKRFEPLRD